jgi:hypothetical protein
MPSHVLEIYSKVFSQLENRKLKDDNFEGSLKLTPELKTDLELLEKEGLTTGTYDFTKTGADAGTIALSQIKKGHYGNEVKFKVDLTASKTNANYAVCSGWDYLLANQQKLKTPVKNIFFTTTKCLLTPSSTDEKYLNYLNVNQVYELIKRLAQSTDGGDKTIFFERPLTFEFILIESDLDHPIDLQSLEKLLKKDLHQEAIYCLICKELVSFLKDIEVKQRFSYLFRHMSSLISNVLLSYQSYVESYTFDKVRKEYLEKRTEYITKIHSVFDTMATKLLSLPAGIWFATTQINLVEINALNDIVFYKNLVVLITILLLCALLILNLIGQYSILSFNSKEYTQVFDELKKSFDDEAVQIGNAKVDIDNEYAKVCTKLGFAIFVTISLLALTMLLFCNAFS